MTELLDRPLSDDDTLPTSESMYGDADTLGKTALHTIEISQPFEENSRAKALGELIVSFIEQSKSTPPDHINYIRDQYSIDSDSSIEGTSPYFAAAKEAYEVGNDDESRMLLIQAIGELTLNAISSYKDLPEASVSRGADNITAYLDFYNLTQPKATSQDLELEASAAPEEVIESKTTNGRVDTKSLLAELDRANTLIRY